MSLPLPCILTNPSDPGDNETDHAAGQGSDFLSTSTTRSFSFRLDEPLLSTGKGIDRYYVRRSHNDRGYTCAQVFFGMTSKVINVYGMKSKSEFPQVYTDFLRTEGIPTVLRRDNAPEEQSAKVTRLQ